MLAPHLIGLAIIAIPIAVVGYFAFRTQSRVSQFVGFALALTGLLYLANTPAPTQIARVILGQPY